MAKLFARVLQHSFLPFAAGLLAGGAIPLQASPAAAATLTGVGQSFTVDFVNAAYSLNATAIFTVSGLTLDGSGNISFANFDVAITNASGTTSRLTSLGFATSPELNTNANASYVTSTSSNLNGTKLSFTNFPGFQQVEACFATGNNCAAANGAGLSSQPTTTGTLGVQLGFNQPLATSITIDTFAAKFASVGSYGGNSLEIGGTERPPTAVPEPTPLLPIIVLGVLVSGALYLKSRSALAH